MSCAYIGSELWRQVEIVRFEYSKEVEVTRERHLRELKALESRKDADVKKLMRLIDENQRVHHRNLRQKEKSAHASDN